MSVWGINVEYKNYYFFIKLFPDNTYLLWNTIPQNVTKKTLKILQKLMHYTQLEARYFFILNNVMT